MIHHPAVVANPTKTDDRNALQEQVDRLLADRGLPAAAWYWTTQEDAGASQTRAALDDGADLVLSYGGDGTVRAVVSVLVGGDVPLGVIPAGSGNLLSRNLGIPLDVEEALEVAVTGRPRTLDVGEFDGEVFAVMAGLGFDAVLMDATPEVLKARLGWIAYGVAAARALRTTPRLDLTISVDGGHPQRHRGVGVLVGNVGTLTAGLALMPSADPADGILDLTVLMVPRARDWVGLGVRLMGGRRPATWQVRRLTGQRFDIRATPVTAAEIDGELLGDRESVQVRVVPGALRVMVAV